VGSLAITPTGGAAGGRVDHGETLEAAALREATEEIGVDPKVVSVAA
jgi:ADP-ribose pyrophosphatase YjhB (NUDIX family)